MFVAYHRYSTESTRYLPIHMFDTDANSPPVSFKLLHLGQLHDRFTHIPQAFGGQVRAGDVLDERAQVDTRVLLGVAVRCCTSMSVHIFTSHDGNGSKSNVYIR